MKIGQELRHTIELVAGGGVTAVLTLAYVLTAGRMLGPAAYADFSAALSIFYFVTVATSPLMPTTARLVTLYGVRGDAGRADALERAILRKVARWSALAAVPLLLLAAPLARWLRFDSTLPLALSLVAAFLFVLVSIRRGVLQGLGRFGSSVGNTVIEAALRLAGAIAILSVVPTPAAALAAYVGALFVADLLLWRRLGQAPETTDWSEVRALALPMLIAVAGVAVYQYADMLFVKRWFDATAAGEYGAASTLARATSVLFVPVYTLAGPLLTAYHARGEALAKPTLRLCLYFVALAALPTAAFALAGEAIITVLYGPAFASAGALLAKLAGVPVLTYLSLIIAQAFITVRDRTFGPVYLAFAVLQVAAFILARGSISAIILSLYVVQGTLLVVMAAMLAIRKC